MLAPSRSFSCSTKSAMPAAVKDIEMLETKVLESATDRFTVEARWNVFGSVGHWGHVHQRTNAYHANITVADVDGAWKLTGLEILQEERL